MQFFYGPSKGDMAPSQVWRSKMGPLPKLSDMPLLSLNKSKNLTLAKVQMTLVGHFLPPPPFVLLRGYFQHECIEKSLFFGLHFIQTSSSLREHY